MCGIAGCILPDGRAPARAALERMAGALAHRGPDDAGIEVVGSVGLVHRRLAIVDLSPAGHQPMRHPAGRWWLTYNGEVFNHLELRRRLPGRAWTGGSDTETLLHALEHWGDDAIARCNGLFAYAALDLERRRLLLVRDRFGIKPLYVARWDGGLWFASEVRALLAAGLPPRIRPDVLRHSVFASWANGSATLVEGVERVLPGTYLEIQLDALTTRSVSWYDPLEAVDVERAVALGRASREDATRALEAALRSSVRRRLMGDCPIGAMCSGGIDSSLVAAFARDEQPGIHAFNAAIVDQPEWNEADWAELVAREHDLELHTAACDAAGWRAGFVGATLHNEFPLVHPGTVPMAAVASLAHQDGVKVLLSGEGADELFGGYEFLHRRDYADFQVQAAPAAARLRAYAGRALGRQRGLTRLGLRAAGRPLPPGRPPPDPIGGAFPPAVEYVVAGRARAFEAYRHHRGPRRRLEAALAADLRSYLPHLLNRQDKNTMQHSVETRVPFLDPEVVALALNLPLELRMLPLRKGILRDLAARHLPTGVATRPKIGFGFAVKDYFQQARTEFLVDGRMRDVLEVPARDWSALVGGADDDLELLLWSGEVLCRSLGGESAEAIEQALWLDPIGPQAARAKAVIRP